MPIPGPHRLLLSVASVAATVAMVATAHPAPRATAATTPWLASPLAGPRTAGTVVCDTFGSTDVDGGRYVVQNDVWGSDDHQCVRAFDVGFEVTEGTHHNTDQPAAYPSILTGCNYGTCTAGTHLPRKLTELGPVTSTWGYTAPADGTWTAAYDIWFDPTPRRDGTVTGTEMMIWLRTTGPAPIGQRTGTVTIAGAQWDVWRGVNGAQVVSYVRTQPVDRVDGLDLSAFVRDAQDRGALDPASYLTSVQAGFEPWSGPPGFTTTDFAVTGVAD